MKIGYNHNNTTTWNSSTTEGKTVKLLILLYRDHHPCFDGKLFCNMIYTYGLLYKT